MLVVKETHQTPTWSSINYIPKYDWLGSNDYWYWTMSPCDDSITLVYGVYSKNFSSAIVSNSHRDDYGVVRPVIVLNKNALSS